MSHAQSAAGSRAPDTQHGRGTAPARSPDRGALPPTPTATGLRAPFWLIVPSSSSLAFNASYSMADWHRGLELRLAFICRLGAGFGWGTACSVVRAAAGFGGAPALDLGRSALDAASPGAASGLGGFRRDGVRAGTLLCRTRRAGLGLGLMRVTCRTVPVCQGTRGLGTGDEVSVRGETRGLSLWKIRTLCDWLWGPANGGRAGPGMLEERRGGGGGCLGCMPKRPKSTSPFVNCIFSHHEIWVQGGRLSPPLLRLLAVLIYP